MSTDIAPDYNATITALTELHYILKDLSGFLQLTEGAYTQSKQAARGIELSRIILAGVEAMGEKRKPCAATSTFTSTR